MKGKLSFHLPDLISFYITARQELDDGDGTNKSGDLLAQAQFPPLLLLLWDEEELIEEMYP